MKLKKLTTSRVSRWNIVYLLFVILFYSGVTITFFTPLFLIAVGWYEILFSSLAPLIWTVWFIIIPIIKKKSISRYATDIIFPKCGYKVEIDRLTRNETFAWLKENKINYAHIEGWDDHFFVLQKQDVVAIKLWGG